MILGVTATLSCLHFPVWGGMFTKGNPSITEEDYYRCASLLPLLLPPLLLLPTVLSTPLCPASNLLYPCCCSPPPTHPLLQPRLHRG